MTAALAARSFNICCKLSRTNLINIRGVCNRLNLAKTYGMSLRSVGPLFCKKDLQILHKKPCICPLDITLDRAMTKYGVVHLEILNSCSDEQNECRN